MDSVARPVGPVMKNDVVVVGEPCGFQTALVASRAIAAKNVGQHEVLAIGCDGEEPQRPRAAAGVVSGSPRGGRRDVVG